MSDPQSQPQPFPSEDNPAPDPSTHVPGHNAEGRSDLRQALSEPQFEAPNIRTDFDPSGSADADGSSHENNPSPPISQQADTYTRWLLRFYPERHQASLWLSRFLQKQEHLQNSPNDPGNYMIGEEDDLDSWQMARLSRDIQELECIMESYRGDAVMSIKGKTARKIRAAWLWRVKLGSAQDPGGGRE